jgi:hypothetical protein
MKHLLILASHLLAFTAAAIVLVLIVHSQITWDFVFGYTVGLSLLASAIIEYRGRHTESLRKAPLHPGQ